MRRVLFDTSAYSLALRGNDAARAVVQTADQIYLNPIVLGELRAGFLRGRHADKNEGELQEFLSSSRVRVFAIDEETSRRYTLLKCHLKRQGTPVAANDLWIASTALQYGLELITADSDFERISGLLVTLL